MHLALLLPDGPGIRNLQLTRFPELCAEEGVRVTAFTVAGGQPELVPADLATRSPSPGWTDVALPSAKETPLSMLLRYVLFYGHLRWGGTRAMDVVYRQPLRGRVRRRAMLAVARRLGALCASRRTLDRIDRWHQQLVARFPLTQQFVRRFTRDRPDYLLSSHQRPPSTLPPVLAAAQLGIPTGSQIFSWDNLTSKGRIAAPFATYLVWSDLMRAELERFYPHLSPGDTYITGAPQFDPYADPALIEERERFLRRMGVDPQRPVICYSGGDEGTCPEDPQHLTLLLELISRGEIAGPGGPPQMILRPAPVDEGTRYAPVRERFPELVVSQPMWAGGDGWHTFVPTEDDVALLANLTRHCDLNINTASTMSLDFAINDRPVVNLAIDMHAPPVYGGKLIDVYYEFDHYKRVVESGAVRVATSAEQLANHVNDYLREPGLDREQRRALVDLQVGRPIGSACESVLEACLHIAGHTAEEASTDAAR